MGSPLGAPIQAQPMVDYGAAPPTVPATISAYSTAQPLAPYQAGVQSYTTAPVSYSTYMPPSTTYPPPATTYPAVTYSEAPPVEQPQVVPATTTAAPVYQNLPSTTSATAQQPVQAMQPAQAMPAVSALTPQVVNYSNYMPEQPAQVQYISAAQPFPAASAQPFANDAVAPTAATSFTPAQQWPLAQPGSATAAELHSRHLWPHPNLIPMGSS